MYELPSAVQRRHVDDLPAFGTVEEWQGRCRFLASSWQGRGRERHGNGMGMAWYIESGFTVVMGDFEFDIELLLFLVGARPLLWVKTDDIYKDRIENKKIWKEVCIKTLKLYKFKKHICRILPVYETQLIAIYTNIYFLILYNLLFIFWSFAREQLQHLLENNQPHYSLNFSLFTPSHVLIVHQIHFHTNHCRGVLKLITISVSNKLVQNNTGRNNVYCKAGTDVTR
jgi:hypothetical protein